MGHLTKRPILDLLCKKYGLRPEEVVHLGDDLQDLPLLRTVGLGCCPLDAVDEVKAVAHWTVPVAGGRGVLRAVAEQILRAQGHWDEVVASY